jgi:uncharacterized protein YndB with AHSA1/START domain
MEPLVLKRVFPCTKRRLFDAWSKPALMTQWFFGSQQPRQQSTVDNTFTVGGRYAVTMHLQSGDFKMTGEYRAIDRYHHIAFTWSSHIIENSLVDLRFKELSPNRTELTLTQTEFPDEAVRTSHMNGWGLCLDNLERFVAATGDGADGDAPLP